MIMMAPCGMFRQAKACVCILCHKNEHTPMSVVGMEFQKHVSYNPQLRIESTATGHQPVTMHL